MDKHEDYKRQGMSEGHPGNINPDDINRSQPAKAISETEKLERNESALGINQSLKASSEYLDQEVSQIDEETKKMNEKPSHNTESSDNIQQNEGN
jgi:hypothetical protein